METYKPNEFLYRTDCDKSKGEIAYISPTIALPKEKDIAFLNERGYTDREKNKIFFVEATSENLLKASKAHFKKYKQNYHRLKVLITNSIKKEFKQNFIYSIFDTTGQILKNKKIVETGFDRPNAFEISYGYPEDDNKTWETWFDIEKLKADTNYRDEYDIWEVEEELEFLLCIPYELKDDFEDNQDKTLEYFEYNIGNTLDNYLISSDMVGLILKNINGFGQTTYEIVEAGQEKQDFIFRLKSNKGSTYYIDEISQLKKYEIVDTDKAKKNWLEKQSKEKKQSEAKNPKDKILENLVDDHLCENPNLIIMESEKQIQTKQQTKQQIKGNFMQNLKQTACAQGASNIDAAKLAANITAGKLINNRLAKMAGAQLPMGMGGIAKKPIFKILLSNAIGLAIKQFMPDNEKAAYVAQASLNASALDLADNFNLEEMLDVLLDGINMESLTGSGQTDEEIDDEDEKLLKQLKDQTENSNKE